MKAYKGFDANMTCRGFQAVKVGSLVLGELIEPGVTYRLIDGFVTPVGAEGEALA